MYDYEAGAALFSVVRLFDQTLRAVFAVPELAVFPGTALLLIVVGIFSYLVRRGKRM